MSTPTNTSKETTHTGWRWEWTGTNNAAPTTRIPTPDGAQILVGATSPTQVTGIHAPTPAALHSLTDIVGQPWVRELIAVTGPGGTTNEHSVPQPQLTPAWQRLAVVRSVRQWSPLSIATNLLDLDEALAWHAAGVTPWARTLTRLSADTITRARAALTHGALPVTTHGDVETAVTLAHTYLDPEDPALAVLNALEVRTAQATHIDPDDLAAQLQAWSREHSSPVTPAAATLSAQPADTDVTIRTVIDPLLIPARVLTWSNPGHPGITAEIKDSTIHVTLEIAHDLDPEDPDVTDLVVYLTNPATGDKLTATPTPTSWGAQTLTATFPLPHDVTDLVIGACTAGNLDQAPTRPDDIGRANASQHLLGTWALTRTTIALEGPSIARKKARSWSATAGRACDATDEGRDRLTSLREHLTDLTGDNPPPAWRAMLAEAIPAELLANHPSHNDDDAETNPA